LGALALSRACRIADVLGVSVDWLTGRSNVMDVMEMPEPPKRKAKRRRDSALRAPRASHKGPVHLSDRMLVFTARPGRLKEEVAIDLPRRKLSVKITPEFTRYSDHIWRLLEEAAAGGELQHAAELRH
jgi:hypothetical protein